MSSSSFSRYFAELLGTFLLVLAICGSVVIAGPDIGALGVALTAGFTWMALIYALGPVSGAHLNPAITIGSVLAGRLPQGEAVPYIVMQILGGILGAGALYFIASGKAGFNINDGFALNGFESRSPDGYNAMSCAITEGVFTGLLVFTALTTTTKGFEKGFKGLVLGGLLLAIHLITLPITGTSVNFARSLGVAIFAGGEAMTQLWLFAAAQFAGTFVGLVFFKKIYEEEDLKTDWSNTLDINEHLKSQADKKTAATKKPTVVKSTSKAAPKKKAAAARRK